MTIKDYMAYAVEIITGKRCENCKHNRIGCKNPDDALGKRCREGIYPWGFEKREG